mgnify:CR=1 FL=1
MKQKKRNSWIWTIGLTAAIFIIGVIIAFKMIQDAQEQREKKSGPRTNRVINPSDVNPELVDTSVQDIESGHIIGSFAFLNQFRDTIDNSTVDGKVYVADFFFTTCPGICIAMSKQLQRVQKRFAENEDFLILSHTVWPEVDTPEVLFEYAQKYDAIKGKWHFLTGPKEDLYSLARKSYFTLKPAAVGEKGDGDSDFIHTSNMVLVDRKGQIRGYYDGTNPEEVDDLIEDAQRLLSVSY